jgi:cyclophilin family peptidyl-prolyl cis-trans isomerase
VGKKTKLIQRFNRSKTAKLGFERLEDRQLLASNVLASVQGALGSGDGGQSELTEAVFDLSIHSETHRVTLGFMVTPTGQVNELDPAAPRILHSGVLVTPIYSSSDAGQGRNPGLTLTELASGQTYSVVVGHESPGAGDFRLDAFLPGDVSGDGRVDQSELARTSAAVVQSQFGGNHVSRLFFRGQGLNASTNLYQEELDANYSAVIDGFDLGCVKRNVGWARVSTVTPGANTPPVAWGDTAQIDAQSRDNRIQVLRNDSTTDAGESLSIFSAGSTTAGGSVRIAPDGQAVLYTPAAGFLGTERFQYMISDGRGGTAEAIATMQVTAGPSPLDEHIHASMSIYFNGEKVPDPPANIGVLADRFTSAVHTHGADGRIHIHPISQVPRSEPSTLGDFFDTWRTNAGLAGNNPSAIFNENQILQYVVDDDHVIRMFVNGVPNFEFENYIPENEDQIVISYEPLTDPGTPTIVPIADVTIQAGAPLHIPLDGFDFEGDPLTFTATSSNPSLVSTYIPQDNRSMRINVEDFGVMTFELFDDRVPRVTDAIAGLAEQGVYDGVIFHRIIDTFVIQGGDPTGTGFGDPTIPDFDDQFHVDLQHTSAGVLSMAKAGDDTNSSQFFITAAPTRFLDFNHSVFGQLVEGEDVRRAIAQVETDTSDRPVNDVVMHDVQIIVDQENAVLMLKAPEGASGEADVTVTVRDPSGLTHSRTFRVTVEPDTFNGGPFLEDIAEVRTTVNTPVEFELRASDVEEDLVVFDASAPGSPPFTFTLEGNTDDDHTARIRVTPPIDFIGTLELMVEVTPQSGSSTGSGFDADEHVVRIIVDDPAAALAAELAALGGYDESALVDEAITN